MTSRRLVLAAGLFGLIASAARPAVSAPVDLEGTAYGGTASGGWACGPDARTKYGGIGGEARIRLGARDVDERAGRAERSEQGGTISLGLAAEHRDYALLCPQSDCRGSNGSVPASGVVMGASAKVGYDWRWFGFRVGAVPWQSYASATDRGASWFLFPDTSIRVGRMTDWRAELGLGSYNAPTILRPGLWLGLAYVPQPGLEVALHLGVNQTFDDFLGLRGDLAVSLPVTDDLQLGFGGALSEGLKPNLEPEGRMMLIARLR